MIFTSHLAPVPAAIHEGMSGNHDNATFIKKKVLFFQKKFKKFKNSKKKSLLLIDQYTIHVMVFAPLFIYKTNKK